MDMEIYHETNRFLEECFHTLEKPMLSPVPTQHGDDPVLRYQKEHHCFEVEVEVAIIQKLARYISGLNASLLLIESGFIQETGVIFRTLVEFFEDILFLALSSDDSEVTETRKKHLAKFFQEEICNSNHTVQSTQKRKPPVSRRDIRNAIEKIVRNSPDDSKISKHLSQLYSISSGYVHGNSGRICEMVNNDTLRYCLAGMAETRRQDLFIRIYSRYAYLGLCLVSLAAKSPDNATVREAVNKFVKYFEKTTSETDSVDLKTIIKELSRKNT